MSYRHQYESEYSRNNNFNPLMNRDRDNYISRYENQARNEGGRIRLRNTNTRYSNREDRGYDIISGQRKHHYQGRTEPIYATRAYGRKPQRNIYADDDEEDKRISQTEKRHWKFGNFDDDAHDSNERAYEKVKEEIYRRKEKPNYGQYKEYIKEPSPERNYNESRREKNFLTVGQENYGKIRSSTAELYTKDIKVRNAKESGIKNSGNSCYM